MKQTICDRLHSLITFAVFFSFRLLLESFYLTYSFYKGQESDYAKIKLLVLGICDFISTVLNYNHLFIYNFTIVSCVRQKCLNGFQRLIFVRLKGISIPRYASTLRFSLTEAPTHNSLRSIYNGTYLALLISLKKYRVPTLWTVYLLTIIIICTIIQKLEGVAC